MKLFRIYVIVSTLIVSATVFVSCFFVADENTRKTGLGEEYAVIALEIPQDFSAKEIINGISETIKEIIDNSINTNRLFNE